MWGGEELDLDAYLARIGHSGELAPDLATLRSVHRANVETIPFENLDVALGRRIPLDVKSLQAKLVGRRRGGYCYEQNSLLAAALERIGFEVAGRGARNRSRGHADVVTPITHAVLVVTVDGEPWLADAGFGWQGPLEPVPLADGVRVEQDGWVFGVGVEAEGVHVLRALRPEGWTDLYAFAPHTLFPVDFELMNHYSSGHPRSRFLGQVVAHLPGATVRRALVRDGLTSVNVDGSRQERLVDAGQLVATLSEVFGIEPDEEEAAGLLRVHSGEV
ncbi:arylamine N-acetyltransferase family protein [Streptomyces roseicoloratus]|uniref:Arylamine N-acetyltransferase n=1 Tax=Streptomyces roseicoloratus TaxID=2508722 RepID=A0ABY9RRW7_9ACTN|nr:arylamine N-acetyltransferase [Streptomyces roseicoloratus]WMX44702.1 arylamine N-acetyltransferase [Streptomyces roseicoloratus]